jgi:hypothetical protein
MPRPLKRTDVYLILAIIAILAVLKYFGLLHEATAGGQVVRLGW